RAPVLGCEFEEAVLRPDGQEPGEVPEIALGLDVVELGGGDERHDCRSGLGVLVGADKQPIATPDDKSKVILPMSRFARRSTIDAMRGKVGRWTLCTARSARAKRSLSA